MASANFNRKVLATVKIDGTTLGAMLMGSDLARLAEALYPVHFEEGEAVVEEGSVGGGFFIVKSGTAEVSTRRRGAFLTLREGEFSPQP